jgi:hypothetical protein
MPSLRAALPLMTAVLAVLQLLQLWPAAAAAASPQCSTTGGAGTSCYVGGALQRLPELTAAACCEACASDPSKQCGCWEIRGDQDGICVLKAAGAEPRPSGGNAGNCSASGCIGGGPPAPPAPPGPPAPPAPPAPPSAHRLAFDSMFAGGAVLQMDTETAVWGWNAPNTAITLSLDGKVVAHAAPTGGSDGNYTWRTRLP